MESYVERATSAFYPTLKGVKPLPTFTAFQEAAKQAPNAAAYWLERLRRTTMSDYEEMFRKIPDSEITEPARRFALRILELNRMKLLRV